MRDLKSWLGYIVLVTGTVSTIEERRFCMENVRIAQYKDNSDIRVIDHLWIYMTQEEVESCAELRKNYPKIALKEGRDVGFVGNVVQYTRKNGSSDYAVKSNGHAARALYPLSGDYKDVRLLPATVRLDYLVDLFQCLKKSLVWFNFERVSYADFIKEVEESISCVRRELEDEELTRVKIKQSLSHRKGNIRPDPIKFKSGKSRQLVKGFSK